MENIKDSMKNVTVTCTNKAVEHYNVTNREVSVYFNEDGSFYLNGFFGCTSDFNGDYKEVLFSELKKISCENIEIVDIVEEEITNTAIAISGKQSLTNFKAGALATVTETAKAERAIITMKASIARSAIRAFCKMGSAEFIKESKKGDVIKAARAMFLTVCAKYNHVLGDISNKAIDRMILDIVEAFEPKDEFINALIERLK